MEKVAADLHNFGNSVQKTRVNGEVFYMKPRPVFWEWLFFGKESPLKTYFLQARSGVYSPGLVLFNLETEIENDFSGRSKEVVSSSSDKVTDLHEFSLGVILAYSYIFGIRDLHRQNIVKTNTHLQVVDAEVVLAKLLLPHETLLLPYKEVDSSLCGAAHVLDLNSEIRVATIEHILNGYMETFECFFENLSSLNSVFDSLSAKMRGAPIRHILRDTVHYRDAQNKQPEFPFFASELEQMNRGDIPYFFKFIGKDDVWEIIDPTWKMRKTDLPEFFKKGADREAKPIREILNESRIRKQLLPTGLLYIVKTLTENSSHKEIHSNGYQISLTEEKIDLKTKYGRFSARKF